MIDFEPSFGMHRLWYPLRALEITYDTRLATLTFRTTERPANRTSAGIGRNIFFTLRLDKFASFEADIRRLRSKRSKAARRRLEIFLGHLEDLTANREPPPNDTWRRVFGDLAFLLIRYAHKHPEPYLKRARDLLIWLGARDARSAWRLSYDRRLSFEHRYKLLKPVATNGETAAVTTLRDKAQLDLPEKKERELFWWTALRRYDLALEWSKSEVYRNLSARRALREETSNYLHVLKDEPRQQELRRFLSQCGTDIEAEVKRVIFHPSISNRSRSMSARRWSIKSGFRTFRHFLRTKTKKLLRSRPSNSNLGINVTNDEVIRRAFFVWFLKRYDWRSAKKLIFSGPKRRWLRKVACGFLALNVLAVIAYVIQIDEPRVNSMGFFPSANGRVPLFWAIQVGLQLLSLAGLLLIAPVLFRLLMPRGFFGSLLAWCTVIFLAMKDVRDFEVGVQKSKWLLISACHSGTLSEPQLFAYSVPIALGILLLGSVFVGYTVTQFTEGVWKILVRTLTTLGFLLLGSLFWALAFALPIKMILERDTFQFDCHCVIPIVVIGSAVAVLFGLMVELIWQDQSLAEPLGEPL